MMKTAKTYMCLRVIFLSIEVLTAYGFAIKGSVYMSKAST